MIRNRVRLYPRSGISLIEILITVAVLAVLAAVALPSYRSIQTQSLESVARVFAADLRLARSQAIQHNTNYTVLFDSGGNAYQIVHTGSGTPPALRNTSAGNNTPDGIYRVELDHFGATRRQQSGVELAGAQLAESQQAVADVTFGPTGGTGPSRSEDTVITLTANNTTSTKSIRITISWITGQVWTEPVTVTPN